MKKVSTFFLMTVLIGYIFAQTDSVSYRLPKSNEELTFVFSEKSRDTALVRVLLENSPQWVHSPGMPRFAIIGKDREFYLGIGGYVKASLSYDIGNPIANNSMFETSNIPMDNPAGNKGLFQIGAQTSSINFNFVSSPHTENQIGAYIDFCFLNPGYVPFIMNAYATYRGLTAGWNFSLFTDLMADPLTIDFQGPNSLTLLPNAVLDYETKFGKHWGIGIGLEMPVSSFTNGNNAVSVNQLVPDIPAYVQYSWNNRNSYVRLSGILRNMQYRDLVADKNINQVGWGSKISGSAGVTKWITTYYQFVAGKGIASYIQDLNGKNMDMTPYVGQPGRLDNTGVYGGYFGLQLNLPKSVIVSCTYSGVNVFENKYNDPNQYKTSQYLVGNVFWNLAPNVQMGVEYIYGNRKNLNTIQKDNHRFQTMIQINF